VYLALAAQLLAGLDGIKNRIDPTAEGYGPIDKNIFTWTEEERGRIRSLPTSLSEACNALEADMAFLLEGDVFDQGQLKDYIAHLRAHEADVRNRPHPYEMALYFDV
jgi:glutamine synthetase